MIGSFRVVFGLDTRYIKDMEAMKVDIREQKIRLWLKNPPEMIFPEPLDLPKFSKKSFRNYDEMNAWKREYLAEIAARGGIKWKLS